MTQWKFLHGPGFFKEGKCSVYTYFTFKAKISQERLQAARGKSKTDCITIDYN